MMCDIMNIADEKITKARLRQNGNLAIRYESGEVREGLKARRLFPLTNKDGYINLVDRNDEEVGIILDLRSLDKDSRDNIRMSLERYYVLPQILEIISIEEKYGIGRWDVSTNKGKKSFEVVNNNTDIKKLGGGHLVIIDSDDNRYEIRDYKRLNNTGRKLLEERL